MRLELIDGIRLLIIAFLAYIPTVTISGWFTAWVAKRCDDDLPERFGFLTLDPFAHFSFFGFTFMLIGELFGNYLSFFKGFPGFGRFIILDPRPESNKAKAIMTFFARSLAHFIMLTTVVLVMTVLFQKAAGFLLQQQFQSFFASLKDVVIFFFKQNLILCTIYFLFGVADSICFVMQIPRMFSFHYFGVLIAVLLLLSDAVNILLEVYVALLQRLLMGIL